MPNMVREEGDRRMGSMRVSLAFAIRTIPVGAVLASGHHF